LDKARFTILLTVFSFMKDSRELPHKAVPLIQGLDRERPYSHFCGLRSWITIHFERSLARLPFLGLSERVSESIPVPSSVQNPGIGCFQRRDRLISLMLLADSELIGPGEAQMQ
jgi:hypothetical protein